MCSITRLHNKCIFKERVGGLKLLLFRIRSNLPSEKMFLFNNTVKKKKKKIDYKIVNTILLWLKITWKIFLIVPSSLTTVMRFTRIHIKYFFKYNYSG